MSSKREMLFVKVVSFTEAELARIEMPTLSPAVRQIIADSKIPSLQRLLVPNVQQVLRGIVQDYWARK